MSEYDVGDMDDNDKESEDWSELKIDVQYNRTGDHLFFPLFCFLHWPIGMVLHACFL